MKQKQGVAVLGSTGSIGQQALDVIRNNQDKLDVVALATHQNLDLLRQQAEEFSVRYLAVGDSAFFELFRQSPWFKAKPYELASVEELCFAPEADIVLNAMVGAAGLRASYAALKAGKRLALANKESLVVGGDLLRPLAASGQLIPVDSEHSAIFQCLVGESDKEVSKIWLTASGGPFRGWQRSQLAEVLPADALAHPNWRMGPKISIDSATMMNKGLEAIEAMHLFSLDLGRIQVVIHPQSVIHSMVEFVDGSVKAQLGPTDMRVPIQYAFSFPERWPAPLPPLDFLNLNNLSFQPPDLKNFGCLRLAMEAARQGGTAPCVLNAANEVAVAAFLAKRCGFLDIENCVQAVLDKHQPASVTSLEQLEAIDQWSRVEAEEFFSRL